MTTFLLIEGFDVYPNVNSSAQGVEALWSAVDTNPFQYGGVSLAGGRFGGQSIFLGQPRNNAFGGIARAITASGSLTIGFAFNLSQTGGKCPVISLLNGGPQGTYIWGMAINQSQQPYMWVGSGGPAASSSVVGMAGHLTTGAWHYFEAIWQGGVAGAFTVYMDGLQAMTFSGNTGTLNADTFGLTMDGRNTFQSHASGYFDDLYVASGTSRIGERKVETKYPTANDAVAWSPLANTNWQEVSETLCDGDTSYNSSSTVNAQDTFAMQALTTTPANIDAVQVRNAVRTLGTNTYANVLKSGATTSVGATYTPASTYGYDLDIFTTDPNTSAAWTAAGVNAAKGGYKLLS